MKEKRMPTPMQQLNAFAMQGGGLVGLCSLVGVVSYARCIGEGWMGFVFLFVLLFTPWLQYRLTRSFRDQTTEEHAPFPYSKAYLYAVIQGGYAMLITALGTYLYFVFADKGYFINSMIATLNDPAVAAYMESQNLPEMVRNAFDGQTITEVLEQVSGQMAQLFTTMVLYFFIITVPLLSLLIAALTKRAFRPFSPQE